MMVQPGMSIPSRLLATFAALSLALTAAAPDQWFRIATPHFEIYSSATDANAAQKKSHDALLALEDARRVIMDMAQSDWNQAIPVRIISFQSEKQYKPYAPNNGEASYSSNSQSRDYLVMLESDPDHLPIALHQYVHLALQHSGLKLPMWLSEGLAEVLTTEKPAGSDMLIGGVLKDHIEELKTVKWIDFPSLTSANERSPYYNEGNRAGQFYAESWALVHMLYLGRDYHADFGKMLAALNDGKGAAEAWQLAWGKSADRVYADLQAYVKQNSLVATTFPAKRADAIDRAVASPASDLDSGVMLADLLAAMNRKELATAAYDKLAKQYPGSPEIAKSLGYLAWQSGDDDTARKYFEQALPGTRDPQMCYHLAMLYHDSGQGGDKLLATLTKAVSLKPDYGEARLQLGLLEYNRRNYPGAIAALAPIDQIAPERAATLYNALAYAYAETGDLSAARKALETGRKWNKTAAEKQRAEELARFLDSK